jgi:hypothetical protein
MADKERYQNPVIGDDLTLRLFTYNSNNRADVSSLDSVSIYFLDPQERTPENPDGRRLVQTIAGSDVVQESTGQYTVEINLEDAVYTIGDYLDIWSLVLRENQAPSTIENSFHVYPDLWFATATPIVYDFRFSISPNRLRIGSKRWLVVDILPNVPRATDLIRYYENLAIVSPLKISICNKCNECATASDLDLIVDEADVELRDKAKGYYFFDTTDLDLGIYDVWFTMQLGESLYVSEKQQVEIF